MPEAPTTSGLPRPPRIPYPRGVACSRIWASWRLRSTMSRSSCRPGNREDGSSRAHRKQRIGASPVVACASSMSIAASSAVASSMTPTVFGRPAFAIALWKSVVRCIIFGCVFFRGNQWFNRNELWYAYCCTQSIVGHGYKSFYLTTVSPPPFILPLLTVVPNLARLSLSGSGAISTMRWPGSSSPISPLTAWHQPLAPGL
jgi:hypothetical protein